MVLPYVWFILRCRAQMGSTWPVEPSMESSTSSTSLLGNYSIRWKVYIDLLFIIGIPTHTHTHTVGWLWRPASSWLTSLLSSLSLSSGHAMPIRSLTFSPDSQLLVTASDDGYIKIYDVWVSLVRIVEVCLNTTHTCRSVRHTFLFAAAFCSNVYIFMNELNVGFWRVLYQQACLTYPGIGGPLRIWRELFSCSASWQ